MVDLRKGSEEAMTEPTLVLDRILVTKRCEHPALKDVVQEVHPEWTSDTEYFVVFRKETTKETAVD